MSQSTDCRNFLYEEMVLELPGDGESSGSEEESDQEAVDNLGTGDPKGIGDKNV